MKGGRPCPVLHLEEVLVDQKDEVKSRFQIEQLEERIAPSNGNFPPGQNTTASPAQAPGQSNPNGVPPTDPSNDK
jgi:hypothetical protein